MKTDVGTLLGNKTWPEYTTPYRHFLVENVFVDAFVAELEDEFHEILSRGLSDTADPSCFSRTMKNTEAYGWHFPQDIKGPLAFFYSNEWHSIISNAVGIECSGQVSASLHHHVVGSVRAAVHQDLSFGYFPGTPGIPGIRRMDLSVCKYVNGHTLVSDAEKHRAFRAITVIYFFANGEWKAGGETGLYRAIDSDRLRPAKAIQPINNSMLVFENRPGTYHSSMPNHIASRNSLVMWLHRAEDRVRARWGGIVPG